jgi:hypothetical protein
MLVTSLLLRNLLSWEAFQLMSSFESVWKQEHWNETPIHWILLVDWQLMGVVETWWGAKCSNCSLEHLWSCRWFGLRWEGLRNQCQALLKGKVRVEHQALLTTQQTVIHCPTDSSGHSIEVRHHIEGSTKLVIFNLATLVDLGLGNQDELRHTQSPFHSHSTQGTTHASIDLIGWFLLTYVCRWPLLR